MTVKPREVEFRIKTPAWTFRTLYVTSTTPIPAVMQACHESRNLGLYERGLTVRDEPRYIWVNFDIDLISIGKAWFHKLGGYRRIVRRLKFQAEDSSDFFHSISPEWKEFTNLNEMYVVCEDGVLSWQDAWEYLTWPCPRDHVRFIDMKSGEMVDGYTLDKRMDEILARSEEDEA